MEFDDENKAAAYKEAPLMLLNPTRKLDDEKQFRYSIGMIPKNPHLLAD